MSYKYTIIQENNNTKTRLTYEFAANDEDDMVTELNCFMNSIGFVESGYLALINDEEFDDDLDSEVEETIHFGKSEINPELESYKNFEFPIGYNKDYEMYGEGQGQTEYTFVSDDADKIAEQSKNIYSTWPFPLDRPSGQTYRVDDSIYNTDNANVLYYGA